MSCIGSYPHPLEYAYCPKRYTQVIYWIYKQEQMFSEIIPLAIIGVEW